jgi:tetratricopeptide (TPR) repeat protein
MNKNTRSNETVRGTQSASIGKLSDLRKIMKLAFNSFGKEKYSLAIDYCRKAIDAINGTAQRELAAEAYYLWCLSCLKNSRPDEAKKVCYEARLLLGNYLDSVYFEILIAAVKEEIDKIPRLVKNYMEIYEAAGGNFNPSKEKTHGRAGEVLLMGAQALEQAGEKIGALEFYNKYLSIFPDDGPIRERVDLLSDRTRK